MIALYGGEKIKSTPFGTGKRFGAEELRQLEEALEQNTLFYWFGSKVKQLTKKFSELYGIPYCTAVSSGTAAIHTALGAVGVTEGDEVITTPITDMGTVIGILYQNAIPVFADVDPDTYNIDPKRLEEKITDKTKAIIAVHLAGNPADMTQIMRIAEKYGIKVIEDCAQSYLSYEHGKLAGTFGDVSCFSLNDFKQISAGDGGLCLFRNEELYKKGLRFADKNYNRLGKNTEEIRRVEYIAPNYRMNELTGAVAIAQLDRLEFICNSRRRIGDAITEGIRDIQGVFPPLVRQGNQSSYWFYLFRVDEAVLQVDIDEYIKALNAEGLPCYKGYIHACIYEYDLFRNKSAYQGTHAPFDSRYYGKEIDYHTGLCPVAEEILRTSVKFNISEFYTQQDIDDIVKIIRKVTAYYKGRENI